MGHSHLDPRAGFQANAQSFQSSFSFSYRMDISVHATITQAGLQFQGAQFIPARGTPYGRMEFLIATTTACNIRMFGISGLGMVPIFDSGPIMSGVYPAWANGVVRGAWGVREEPFDHERRFPISFVREGEVPIREPATLTTSTPWMTRRRRSRSRSSVISTLAGWRIRSIPTTASCGWRRYRTCSPPS